MAQTAVEWLEKICQDRGYFLMSEYFEQAKSMEKEQIEVAYSNGSNDRLKNRINGQYYKEKYGSKDM